MSNSEYQTKPLDLVLFDSYQKENIQLQCKQTVKEGTLKVYGCGPTVYNYQSIGNMRAIWLPDTLVKVAKLAGWQTEWISNITDVGHLVSDGDEGEDKLEKGAKREKKTVQEVVIFYTQDFQKQCQALNFDLPSGKFQPRASWYVEEQMLLALSLVNKNLAYFLEEGIYLDYLQTKKEFEKCKKKLSKQLLVILDVLQRAEKGQDSSFTGRDLKLGQKKHPNDFALWKFVSDKSLQKWYFKDFPQAVNLLKIISLKFKEQDEGVEKFLPIFNNSKSKNFEIENYLDKPGCPGWHSECVCMISQISGRQRFSQIENLLNLEYLEKDAENYEIDVHTGGEDHIDIHHKNEIIQAEALGFRLARIWLHNKFVMVDGSKMSKSKGNVYLVSGQFKKTQFYSLENPPTEEFSLDFKKQILKKYQELKLLEQKSDFNWNQFSFDPLAYRLMLFEHHYSETLNFTWEKLWQSQMRLWNLRKEVAKIQSFYFWQAKEQTKTLENTESLPAYQELLKILTNNLDTPKFLERYKDLLLQLSNNFQNIFNLDLYNCLFIYEKELLKLKLFIFDIWQTPELLNLLKQRQQAKTTKDWSQADQLRSKIQAQGWQVDDYSWGYSLWWRGDKYNVLAS